MEIPSGKGKTEIPCTTCSQVFVVKNSTLRFRAVRGMALPAYCSTNCRNIMRYGPTGGKARCTCAACGVVFTTNAYRAAHTAKQFCSLACMGDDKKTGCTLPCHRCGMDVYVTPNRSARHKTFFCSNACRLAEMFGSNMRDWRGFVESSTEYRRLTDRLRKTAQGREWKRNVLARNSCEDCDSTESLHAHHRYSLVNILADNSFDEARVLRDPRFIDPANGVALCGPCHAKVHLQQKSLPAATSVSKPGEMLETP